MMSVQYYWVLINGCVFWDGLNFDAKISGENLMIKLNHGGASDS